MISRIIPKGSLTCIQPEPIKVAGWTCVNTRLSIPTASIDSHPDASEDEDEEVPITASSTSDADEISRPCEWEGCDKTFTGVNASTLIYVSLRSPLDPELDDQNYLQ